MLVMDKRESIGAAKKLIFEKVYNLMMIDKMFSY